MNRLRFAYQLFRQKLKRLHDVRSGSGLAPFGSQWLRVPQGVNASLSASQRQSGSICNAIAPSCQADEPVLNPHCTALFVEPDFLSFDKTGANTCQTRDAVFFVPILSLRQGAPVEALTLR
jgi:hypothetical protein